MTVARDDARALALVARCGRTGTAFQVMSPGMRHWFDPHDRGMVAYVDTGGAWVAAGEPVAEDGAAISVAERFVTAARAAHRRASFFGTEGILASSPSFRRFHLGQQPVWDPQQWSAQIASHRSLREQLRRSRAKGVTVREIRAQDIDASPALRAKLDAVVQHWLAARPMPPMRFLVDVAPLMWLDHRRLWIAERGDAVVGLVSLAPVPARRGWLFENLLRDPHAPNGTSEWLVDAAMLALARDGVTWATLGLAPLDGAVPNWLRWIRRASRPLFNFDGLAAFKRKLRPQWWEPIYLAYPAGASSATALLDGLRAFANGALWRFGVRTVLRGPSPLLSALEWLLIPWTMLLALAPNARWFPSSAIHVAWVCLDVGLYGLLRSVRTGRSATAVADTTRQIALMTTAASLVSADAALTLWQAAAWNAPRLTNWWEAVPLALACAGPLLTAPTLWGAVRRLTHLHGAPTATRNRPAR